MNGTPQMVRLIPALVIMAASILIGCGLSLRLSRRSAVLSDYIALLDTAADRMSYTGESLAAVFSDNFAGFRFDPSKPFSGQWERMTEQFCDVLKGEDREVLCRFAREAGCGDLQAELNHIRLYQTLLKERLDDAREACVKKSALYRILPFSIGLAVTIMIL